MATAPRADDLYPYLFSECQVNWTEKTLWGHTIKDAVRDYFIFLSLRSHYSDLDSAMAFGENVIRFLGDCKVV